VPDVPALPFAVASVPYGPLPEYHLKAPPEADAAPVPA
jgi:hypothetical protein